MAAENNFNSVDSGTSTQESFNRNEPSRSKLKFTDLNEDVHFLIADILKLEDLLSLAETSRMFGPLTNQIFRRNYHDITITRANVNVKNILYKYAANDHMKILELSDIEMIVRILIRFEGAIKQLTIKTQNMDNLKSKMINRFVNRNVANTLIHLHLNIIKENTFEQFTNPFEAVEELSFDVDTKRVNIGDLPLNKCFPALRRLQLRLYSQADYRFLGCKFEQLVHLHVSVLPDAWTQKDQIEELFTKNSHIKSVELRFFPPDYVKLIGNLMPNIENLTLFEFDIGNDTVRFDNVKSFTLHTSNPQSIENLKFQQLESLCISFSPARFESWLTFFGNNQNIQQLELNKFFVEQSLPLLELTANLHNLIDMTLASSNYINVETIKQFIQSHSRMMKFKFSTTEYKKEDKDRLRDEFEKEWTIKDVGSIWSGLLFERKQTHC